VKTQCRNAVIELHAKGYTEDFVLFPNSIWWIQGRMLLTEDEFCVREYKRIYSAKEGAACLVLGIVSFSQGLKGVLLTTCDFSAGEPQLVYKKLRKMAAANIREYTLAG
jgi:hypothetical protein